MSLKRKTVVVLMVVMALVLVTAVAYAITINIDGVREAAWDGGGDITDPNEVGVANDGLDVQAIEWTNDTTNFYILLNTYAATGWNDNNGPDFPYIYFCMNTDNSTATGTANICVQGAGGYDRYIRIAGPTPLAVTVFNQSFGVIAATTSVATANNITELSVDLASLGLSSTNCGTITASAYFDGRTGDPDDSVQDGGDFLMNCGSPTAVTLQNVSASGSSVLPFALGAFGLIVVSTGLVISRKRKSV